MSAVSHAQDIKIMSILGKNMVRCELGGLYSVIALRVTSKSSLKGKQHTPISINKLQPLEMRGKKVLSAAAVPSKPDSWGSKKIAASPLKHSFALAGIWGISHADSALEPLFILANFIKSFLKSQETKRARFLVWADPFLWHCSEMVGTQLDLN